MKKRIAILGSTGSIGTQALQVIEKHPEHFELKIISAFNNAGLLIEQALKFKPEAVIITNKDKFTQVASFLSCLTTKVFTGAEALNDCNVFANVDIILVAIVGFAGLLPTINAIKAGKTIALANKETLVVAGELITSLAKKNNVTIFPVDSEHSAIYQCLAGEQGNPVEKIYLTASGGPFRDKQIEFLETVTKKQALQHPNWNMGNKITIDSATLMNKGLEAIEAHWLFNLSPEQIKIIIHPQSVIHSIVQFEDGSMKAQMSIPDMRLPIQYAMSFPKRMKSDYPRFSFIKYPNLTFEFPDIKKFPNLALSFEALRKGGNMPCILNAANEIAVEAFLNDRISFNRMSEIIEKTMNIVTFINNPDFNDYMNSDYESRMIAKNLL
ncbi:MAG: 1-deoxy-D-xylulose-5-phosphate reductoisomerase [Bacteroidia bacterium]|nr:1-deoxy-D-xylulose-5-phosphate reductoisomerase [Bacteroidia bacterium]